MLLPSENPFQAQGHSPILPPQAQVPSSDSSPSGGGGQLQVLLSLGGPGAPRTTGVTWTPVPHFQALGGGAGNRAAAPGPRLSQVSLGPVLPVPVTLGPSPWVDNSGPEAESLSSASLLFQGE